MVSALAFDSTMTNGFGTVLPNSFPSLSSRTRRTAPRGVVESCPAPPAGSASGGALRATRGRRVSTGTGNARVYPAPVLALSLDPKSLLDSLHPYGEIGLILIIFAETGLLFGLILPGDSLLFTGGLLASQGHLN